MQRIGRNQGSEYTDQAEERLMARAAWLYYKEGMTQEEVASRMGLSRVKINRLISQARRAGMVEISIKLPQMFFPEIEQELCQIYGLRDAVVMMETELGEPMYRVLAQGTADWLAPRLSPNMRIAISLGRTISYLPEAFRPSKKVPCTFTEAVGGLSDSSREFSGYNVIARMAELAGGTPMYLHVPTVVTSDESRQVFLSEPKVAEAFEQARRSHILLSSVGAVDSSALLYQHGYLNTADMQELSRRGAVGDVLGHFIEADGRPLPPLKEFRVMSLSLQDLQRIPYSVLVAGGDEKVSTIRAALKARYFNILVTTIKTAQALV